MYPLAIRLLLTLTLVLSSAVSHADLFYRIDIDTRSVTGSSGLIELSLAGLEDSPLAAAELQSLYGGAGEVLDQFGNVAGDLSSTLTLASDMGFADILQQQQFGDVLSLQLRLAGDWLDTLADAGLTFAIKLWSADFQPLLNVDETGDLLRLQLQPGNGVQVELLSEFVMVRPIAIASPPILSLAFIGLVALLCYRRTAT
ncbi:hypothetical protein HPT27_06775 [Permianibacter sp. IMCC34836]|uniref:NF038129 family PEP-CTERM protein n=1 Tax=Permianibacter fluminis TaxID=2738515 RepID=UPI0015576945|nr:NF038129 family PEP-CTERM protein [Permianibacter fluminis]NQD36724.1 hypothetical protein [Permianibacter fluminis]